MPLIDFIRNSKQPSRVDVETERQILKNQEMQIKLKLVEAKWIVEMNRLRPCHMYPILLTHDGLQWVCKSAVSEDAVGCGDSPSTAMLAFDTMWMGNQKEEK
jgi:hypothetical protein